MSRRDALRILDCHRRGEQHIIGDPPGMLDKRR
jgi:hypothetical protein